MKFSINPKIFEQNPDLKIGAVLIKGMDNQKRVSAVEGLLRGVCAQREKEFKDKDIFDDSMVNLWCQTYGRFGVNPKKYPPSIAALLKRVKNGKGLPHVNVLVDLYNYFSLKYMLPIGGEDVDWLCGDLKLTFTKGGEPFRPIDSIEVEHAAEGEAAYLDDAGVTCRYWNYRECERSKFTNKTVNAVILIEDLSKIHMDKFGLMLQEIQQAISKYIGGHIETYILNEENNSLDLGVNGRKNIDDSRVPQQEKAHFLQQQVKKKSSHKPAFSLTTKLKTTKALSFEDQTILSQQIKSLLQKALKKSFPKLKFSDIKVQHPASEEFGDYSTNLALQISKDLKQSPQQIAQKIIENLPKNAIISKSSIDGPGFINFFITENYLQKEIRKILAEKDNYGALELGKGEKIVLDYSAPNIAKPLGIQHLLSTIIGQSLYNIFKKIGFDSISINHLGDWGTQFGKLITAYKKWGNKEVVEKDPISELLKLYVKFHDEAEKDPSLEDEARKEFSDFEKGDRENIKLWKWFVDESMKEINKTYQLLGGIHFDYSQGESFYEDKLADILKEGKEKKVFEKGEDGAYVIHFEDENIPTLPVQKKDGATLYITRDFAALKYRLKTWKPVKILYVVDVAQSIHFRQLFNAAARLGWYKGEAEHIVFGRMQMKDRSMSTRKGNIVLLDDVVNRAMELAEKVIEEKNPELKNKKDVARAVGIGAIKYNVLSQNRVTDIVFDWDKMLSFDGNSAPYLQYSYARAKSIIRKVEEDFPATEDWKKDEDEKLIQEKIHDLIRFFPKFAEQIVISASEYKPNILANYLFELAQKFNSFYNSVPVLRADQKSKKERLRIVEAAAQILKNGLQLLGIDVIEEM